jgi:hypothetical protein
MKEIDVRISKRLQEIARKVDALSNSALKASDELRRASPRR